MKKIFISKSAILAVLADPEAETYICEELRSICYNTSFWSNLHILIDLLDPIVQAIVVLEGNGSICNVFKIWLDLEKIYDPENNNSSFSEHLRLFITNKLNKRWDLIKHNIHPCSFLLDPNCVDISINKENFIDGEEYLKELSGNRWPEFNQLFLAFRAKNEPFNILIQEDISPILFWTRFLSIKETSELSKIAVSILSFPGSCAAIERSFSYIRSIHTRKRNGICRDTLAKLIYIAANKSYMEM